MESPFLITQSPKEVCLDGNPRWLTSTWSFRTQTFRSSDTANSLDLGVLFWFFCLQLEMVKEREKYHTSSFRSQTWNWLSLLLLKSFSQNLVTWLHLTAIELKILLPVDPEGKENCSHREYPEVPQLAMPRLAAFITPS